jgi:hypothetical protein
MNLGSLLGQMRLRIMDLEARLEACTCGHGHAGAGPEQITPPHAQLPAGTRSAAQLAGLPHHRKVDAKKQILDVLGAVGRPLRLGQIRACCADLPVTNASVAILYLLREGKVRRTGEPRFYEYELVREK